MTKMTDFPYAARLEYLYSLDLKEPSPLPRSHANAFRNLMIFVGVVHSAGDAQTKQRLATAVRSGGLPPLNAQAGQHSPTPRPFSPLIHQPGQQHPSSSRPHALVEEMHSQPGEDLNIPRYSMALKEYGDQTGYAIEWNNRQISISPLQFTCDVTVQGLTFQGTARNKKLAKHSASRTACRSIGIEI